MIEAKGGVVKGQQIMRQSGAVSMFVVVFTALLFVAVSVGFTVIINSGQNQTTDNDLAQSALDSAYAGTEDAKRVLAQYTDCQERNILGTVDAPLDERQMCEKVIKAIDSPLVPCEAVSYALDAGPGERLVQQSQDDEDLQQAYTCVRITPDTLTYVGKTRSETDGGMRIIPLKSVGDFDTIRIRWLKQDDMSFSSPSGTANFSPVAKDASDPQDINFLKLPTKKQWLDDDRGALLRVGTMQYNPGDVDLLAMDDSARAMFLYSSTMGATNTARNPIDMMSVDMHRPLTSPNQENLDVPPNAPIEASCSADDTDARAEERGSSMCVTYLKLPNSDNKDLFNYLTVTSVYRDVSFEVSLLNVDETDPLAAPAVVRFKNVQPEIDATGRANNVFRRIVSRVESADANQAPYPRAAVGSGLSVCKNFIVTDDPDDYRDDNAEIVECPNLANPPEGASPTP